MKVCLNVRVDLLGKMYVCFKMNSYKCQQRTQICIPDSHNYVNVVTSPDASTKMVIR